MIFFLLGQEIDMMAERQLSNRSEKPGNGKVIVMLTSLEEGKYETLLNQNINPGILHTWKLC